jgi:DNA-binding MarR family transcriptional regulator
VPEVNAFELFLLGRKLMKLGEQAMPPSRLGGEMTTTVRLVMVDVATYPGSSVSEITERTGFPQSQVSLAVAKLRELGTVVTELDPADRRRTLVRPTEGAIERGARYASQPVDQVVAEAIGTHAEGRLPEVLAALELLGQLVNPEIQPSATAIRRRAPSTRTTLT